MNYFDSHCRPSYLHMFCYKYTYQFFFASGYRGYKVFFDRKRKHINTWSHWSCLWLINVIGYVVPFNIKYRVRQITWTCAVQYFLLSSTWVTNGRFIVLFLSYIFVIFNFAFQSIRCTLIEVPRCSWLAPTSSLKV